MSLSSSPIIPHLPHSPQSLTSPPTISHASGPSHLFISHTSSSQFLSSTHSPINAVSSFVPHSLQPNPPLKSPTDQPHFSLSCPSRPSNTQTSTMTPLTPSTCHPPSLQTVSSLSPSVSPSSYSHPTPPSPQPPKQLLLLLHSLIPILLLSRPLLPSFTPHPFPPLSLGMRHDGLQAGNNCDPGSYIMSPTLGSGKITWSSCSRRYLDAFLK